MKFYLDENLSNAIARAARERGLDVISSHECGRNTFTDVEQLRLAGLEGRCLVTRDAADLKELTHQALAVESPHAGILFVSASLINEDFAGIASALVAYAQLHPGDLPASTVDYLRPAR